MRSAAAVVVVLAAAAASGHESSYAVRGEPTPVSRVASGHVQHVTRVAPGELLVQVSTSMAPVGSDGRYGEIRAGGAAAGVPGGFRLPDGLRSRLSADLSAWEAATRVVEYVMDSVRYVPDDPLPQDARSVLRRRTGRCSGLANAVTALLLSAGFEARTVSGLLVTRDEVIPHRWLECRLPGAGWVGCDPTLGPWVVTASHVAFERPVTQRPSLERVAGGEPDLAALPRRGRWPVRPNHGAELECRPRSPIAGAEVRLLGPWGETRRSQLAGGASFEGLLEGTWSLDLVVDGEVVDRLRVRLEPGRAHTVLVGPAPAGARRPAGGPGAD